MVSSGSRSSKCVVVNAGMGDWTHQCAELVGAHAEVAFHGDVHVSAELGVEENTGRAEHRRQCERERQGEPPADGQPTHPVVSVRSR